MLRHLLCWLLTSIFSNALASDLAQQDPKPRYELQTCSPIAITGQRPIYRPLFRPWVWGIGPITLAAGSLPYYCCFGLTDASYDQETQGKATMWSAGLTTLCLAPAILEICNLLIFVTATVATGTSVSWQEKPTHDKKND